MVKTQEGVIEPTPEAGTFKTTKAPRKRRCHENYKFIGVGKRIDVIYENFLHDRQPHDIASSLEVNYNTVRSILKNFYESGRVNVKKKAKGFTRSLKKTKKAALVDISQESTANSLPDDHCSEVKEERGSKVAGGADRLYRKIFPKFKVNGLG